MDRRTFLKNMAGASSAVLMTPLLKSLPAQGPSTARVVLVRADDRATGTRRALDLLGLPDYTDRRVFLKPNFNSADPAPGSTHNDVLTALVQALRDAGAARITVGDRSGMGNTRAVMEQKGIFALADQLSFETLIFDELAAGDWQLFQPEGSHWQRGFELPRPVLEADAIVQTCCLKTHRYGGHFTLSLKNSVGLAAKYAADGYNYMSELHGSPNQRRMIAEINTAYTPDVVLMDGMEAFVNGGPHEGGLVTPGIILASADRVAIDAVGVAVLRQFGTTPVVSAGPIFQQEQIARAIELGLGVTDPSQIELVTDDSASADFAATLQPILTSAN